MECKINFLTCGYNGTGCSSLLSIEYTKRYSSDPFVENRILINTGDSTQRICSEHRIKFSKVSTVIVSSLAPHNVSGFASVFLSLSDLGVGELTVYGPSGLKSLLDVMTPLINRRYPVLKVVEVEEEFVLEGGLWNADKEDFKGIKSIMKILPIYSSKSSLKSIAIAVRFDFVHSSGGHHTIAHIPVGYYFNTHPRLEIITHWCFDTANTVLEDKAHLLRGKPQRTAIFVPLGIASHSNAFSSLDLQYGKALGASDGNDAEEVDQYTQLKQLTSNFELRAFVYPNELTNSCFEFKHAQRTINKLNFIAPTLFPCTIYKYSNATTSIMDQSVVSTEDAVTISKGSLNFPFPLLEFAQSLIAAKGAEDAGMGKHGVSLKSFVETTTREEALLREVAKDKESLCSSVPITVTSMTSINSPHLTNLTASFQAETSIQKPSKQQDEDPQSDKWESIGNYDAAQALRERLSHSKRKHSQGNNMVVDTVLFRGDDEPKHSSSSQPSEIGNQRLEPLHKRMQRKPSCEVANNFSWSPTANTARFGGNEGDHRLGLSVAPAPEIQNDLFQIYFLGTGCATPSKHRNNSCIMISLQASGVIPPLPPLFEDVPLLSLPVPSLMLPPPPILTIPHSTVLSSSSASLSIPTQLNSSEVDNPFASKSTKPSLSLDLNLDQGKRSNPFASVNKNSSKPSLALDLGLCGLEPAKPASRRPSATLSLDLSLCNSSAGPSGTSTPYNCDISTTVVNDDNSKPIILFDVGEGTASQLFQLVNGDAERFDDYLLRIRVIWISHHHADHTTGLPMLLEHVYRAQLRRRRKLLSPSHKGDSSEDLSPAAPPSLPSLMTKYDMRRNRHGTPSPGYEANKIMIIASEQLLQFYEYAATAAGLEELVTFNPISTSLYAGLTREMRFATNGAVKRLQSVPVQHCQNAYGVVLELADGQKIVFSGDCRPSQSLVKCGLNCDILIHEATFTDDRLEHAMKKRHSTFSEAVDIGRRMSAKHVILTHFSQRYPMTLQTSSPACTTNVMAQTSDSESVPSNPPSVGSSGNMFSNSNSNSVSNQGLRRGSKTNIFSTLSPPKLVSMKSTSSILTDAEGSSLDERVLSSGEEKSFYSNVSIAYDFLQISFPSQIDTLPQATALVANTFSAMEEIEACDDDKE